MKNLLRQMNSKNETPLHFAAMENFKDIGELLISKGADIHAKANESNDMYVFEFRGGKTPLHYAAKNNLKKITEVLIRKGADINAKDIIYQIIL